MLLSNNWRYFAEQDMAMTVLEKCEKALKPIKVIKPVKRPSVEDNLGLAYSAALEFVSPRHMEVEDTEEYADALEALWKACETWTIERGKFSTHAHWCMRNAILNGRRNRNRGELDVTPLEADKAVEEVEKPNELEELLAGKDIQELIYSLFARMPGESKADRRNKKVLFQRYMKNASWEELGQKFGVSRNRAFQYGQQAILLIRKQIKHEG